MLQQNCVLLILWQQYEERLVSVPAYLCPCAQRQDHRLMSLVGRNVNTLHRVSPGLNLVEHLQDKFLKTHSKIM